jgi:hypothetical protein
VDPTGLDEETRLGDIIVRGGCPEGAIYSERQRRCVPRIGGPSGDRDPSLGTDRYGDLPPDGLIGPDTDACRAATADRRAAARGLPFADRWRSAGWNDRIELAAEIERQTEFVADLYEFSAFTGGVGEAQAYGAGANWVAEQSGRYTGRGWLGQVTNGPRALYQVTLGRASELYARRMQHELNVMEARMDELLLCGAP